MPQSEWAGYCLDAYDFVGHVSKQRVLDVGCGGGSVLSALDDGGGVAIGVDVDFAPLGICHRRGLRVAQTRAESLAVRSASVDALVCKVVVPYTDEARAVAEIARVLRSGGAAQLCYHGAGYYARYLLAGPGVRQRLYGLRTIVNTWWYVLTRRRLPGFLGDTLYQSRRRLAQYYRAYGLRLVDESPAKRFLTLPVFIYHHVRKAHEQTTGARGRCA